MKRSLTYVTIFLTLASEAFACWQTGDPVATVKAISLNGRITYDDWGGPKQERITLKLYRAITFDRELARTSGAFEKPTLKTVTTDSTGLFTFGEVKPGHYWIVLGPTLSDDVAVEVLAPDANLRHERVKMRYFADGCRDIGIEEAK